MKPIAFLGTSRRDLIAFPEAARRLAGFELQKVQTGMEPRDWKPMASIGAGVRELRIWSDGGTFRVVYLTHYADVVYVLHAFEKKTQMTSKADLELARLRLKQVARR